MGAQLPNSRPGWGPRYLQEEKTGTDLYRFVLSRPTSVGKFTHSGDSTIILASGNSHGPVLLVGMTQMQRTIRA